MISVYDIATVDRAGQRRLNKIMKTFRKYLHHTQKSVFEGEITEAKLMALRKEVKQIISDKVDHVVFFRIDNKNNVKRETMGIDFDSTLTII
jgi:CRISPR-associated protein Cas2